ncbi:cell wall anchor protein [Lutibacter citreus]|uniref:cell wall anchor protein n=1 Tax=Lutibacter citreus TaxID=2138210 RepID=UPI000DBE8DCE|nr:cell wall anchor protein [Lutibacter citreus]
MKSKKILSIAMLLVFFNLSIFSQVGIGTTSPHGSSVLDLTSTTQGVLTPRMTSTQRTGISSPAKGLLVFDTIEDSFYYFNGSVWVKLEGAIQRDNYKLVKSVADLADELSNGGDSKYLLSDSFTYEINGDITFDKPIELNGANIIGRDTGEDILRNGSGSTFFIGAKGARFKDLVIEGGGEQVFNITGGAGAGSVAAYSVLVKNASSLGIISDLFSVFFEVLQVTSSNNGFDVSNITSFFMDKIFWTGSNSGTFLKLSGTFGNLQIANGRVVADTGETGVDVSANPTITVSASLSEVSFSGVGTRVAGYAPEIYAGYKFNDKWEVECPGILTEKDDVAIGDINLNGSVGSGTPTTFSINDTGTSSRTKLSGNTNSTNLFRFSAVGENRLVYNGEKKRYFNINTSLSFQGNLLDDLFIFYIAKGNNGDTNATVVESTRVYREVGANFDVGALAIVGSVELEEGDFIEVWVEKYRDGDGNGGTNGRVLTVSLNLVIN